MEVLLKDCVHVVFLVPDGAVDNTIISKSSGFIIQVVLEVINEQAKMQ